MLTIKKIIYNPPATIILWNDGTKTTSKCEYGDVYSKEMGFMLCVLKKKYGNQKLHNMLEQYVYGVPEVYKEKEPVVWANKPIKKKKKVALKDPDKEFEVKTFNSLEDYLTYIINDLFALEDE